MKIVIVGSGYVGLVTGACFSDIGIDVTCVDIDKKKIEGLRKGIIPIYEPGLEEMILRNHDKGRLSFTTSLKNAVQECDAVFICVGTPPDEDGSADLKHVLAVASECGKHMNEHMLIVTKSTVPVGTSLKVKAAVQKELDARNIDIKFDVASNPEFLKEGAAINDFLKPDRIVVGVQGKKAREVMKRLYKPFTMNGHPVIFMDVVSAEMTKYAANAMLATKISFMNDIANLCERVDADINEVRRGIGSDTRIGKKFIYPGIGYGGSCFPKDVKALIRTAEEHNYDLRVLQSVEAVNQDQKEVLFKKIDKYFDGDLQNRTVALWGLSFKPQTDDMREAPSLTIVKRLLEAGAHVKAYDPVAMEEARKHFGDSIEYCTDQFETLIDAHCLAILTEWPEFKYPNFKIIKKLLELPVVFDGRNIYEKSEIEENGLEYFSIGRNPESVSNLKDPSFSASLKAITTA